MDDTGRPLRWPDSDQVLPPIPVGLATHRPCLWFPAPCVASAPRREWGLSPDVSDVTSNPPEPKRRFSGIQFGGQYVNAPTTQKGRRYFLDTSDRDPLRGYPPATVLYGMETDSTLLTDPVFTARFEAGRDISRPFNRGERDPATLALGALGASRTSAEEIEMCAWNEGVQRIEIARPLRVRPG